MLKISNLTAIVQFLVGPQACNSGSYEYNRSCFFFCSEHKSGHNGISGQLQNPVVMLKNNTNKNHHPKFPTSQIIFRRIIGGPEARCCD